jgi:hypothetical protein
MQDMSTLDRNQQLEMLHKALSDIPPDLLRGLILGVAVTDASDETQIRFSNYLIGHPGVMGRLTQLIAQSLMTLLPTESNAPAIGESSVSSPTVH